MAKGREFSAHQRKIIDRYYKHRDTIALTKLGDIVGELYLADSPDAKERLWDRAEKALDNLVKEEVITPAERERTIKNRRVEDLAALANAAS